MFYFFFFRLLFVKGTCFKFCLIAVLICYLYFIIYHKAHSLWNTMAVSFLATFIAGGLELGKKWGLGCSKIMLSAMMCWFVFHFQGVLYYKFLIFLALFCFNLYIGNFLNTILQHVLGTGRDFWDGVFCKNSLFLAVFVEISTIDVWRSS